MLNARTYDLWHISPFVIFYAKCNCFYVVTERDDVVVDDVVVVDVVGDIEREKNLRLLHLFHSLVGSMQVHT